MICAGVIVVRSALAIVPRPMSSRGGQRRIVVECPGDKRAAASTPPRRRSDRIRIAMLG